MAANRKERPSELQNGVTAGSNFWTVSIGGVILDK